MGGWMDAAKNSEIGIDIAGSENNRLSVWSTPQLFSKFVSASHYTAFMKCHITPWDNCIPARKRLDDVPLGRKRRRTRSRRVKRRSQLHPGILILLTRYNNTPYLVHADSLYALVDSSLQLPYRCYFSLLFPFFTFCPFSLVFHTRLNSTELDWTLRGLHLLCSALLCSALLCSALLCFALGLKSKSKSTRCGAGRCNAVCCDANMASEKEKGPACSLIYMS